MRAEGARVLAGLRSGDGPLSVRVRPSSLKRDCDRGTMSTGEKCRVYAHAKSRLTPGCLCGHSGQKPRARRSLPGPDAGHPLHTAGVSPGFLRLLPILLPRWRTTADTCRQLWNIGPAHDRRRTVLDDLPTPTDQKVAGSSAKDMREMSEAPVVKAVTSAEVRRSAQEPARAAYPVVRKQRHADRIPPS
jgi:hypothetical protein